MKPNLAYEEEVAAREDVQDITMCASRINKTCTCGKGFWMEFGVCASCNGVNLGLPHFTVFGKIKEPIMSSAWKTLIRRYAGSWHICNCGEAYCYVKGDCRSGCSANQIAAKDYVAQCVLQELSRRHTKKEDMS